MEMSKKLMERIKKKSALKITNKEMMKKNSNGTLKM